MARQHAQQARPPSRQKLAVSAVIVRAAENQPKKSLAKPDISQILIKS